MDTRLKIILGVLVFIAGFMMLVLGTNISSRLSTASIGSAANNTDSTELIFKANKDTDRDGLTDEDEALYGTDYTNPDTDGDGFLDGEEVASGHNPLLSALQGDDSKKQNTTDDFVNLLLLGAASGDINPTNDKDDSYYKNLDQVSKATIKRARSRLNATDTGHRFTVIENNIESLSSYVDGLDKIIGTQDFLDQFQSQDAKLAQALALLSGDNTAGGLAILKKYEVLFSSTAAKLTSLSVPNRLLTFHSNLINSFNELSNDYRGISSIETDPVFAQIAISELANDLVNMQSLILEDFKNIIES